MITLRDLDVDFAPPRRQDGLCWPSAPRQLRALPEAA